MKLAVRILILLLATSAFAKDIALVADKADDFKAISRAEFVKMLKSDQHRRPDGKNAILIMKDPSRGDMEMFAQKMFGMSGDQLKAVVAEANKSGQWIFFVNSDDEVIHALHSQRNAIGVVDIYSINSSVSVVRVDGKLPFEPGYALHGN